MLRVDGGAPKNAEFGSEVGRRSGQEFVPPQRPASEARPTTQNPAGPAGLPLANEPRPACTLMESDLTPHQAAARSIIDTALQDDAWYEWVTVDDMRCAVQALQSLSPADTSAVLQSMAHDGQLTKFVDRSLRRLPVGEHSTMVASLAGKGNADDLLVLDQTFRAAGADARGEYIDLVCTYAQPDAKAEFCAELLKGVSHEGSGGDAADTACRIFGSLQGKDLGNVWEGLNAAQQQAVLNASVRARAGASGPDLRPFKALMSAAASIVDSGQRDTLAAGAMDLIASLPASERTSAGASMAQAVLDSLGGGVVDALSSRQRTVLSSALANGKSGPGPALLALGKLPPSAAREEVVWSIFRETPDAAYQRSPGLAAAMARGLAQQASDTIAASKGGTDALADVLGSQDGRRMLAKAGADPVARFLIVTDILQHAVTSQRGSRDGETSANLAGPGDPGMVPSLQDLTARTTLIAELDEQIVVAAPEDRVRLMLLRDEVDFDRRFYLAEIIRRQSDVILGQVPGLTRDEVTRPVDLQQLFDAEARSRAEIDRARSRHLPPSG